MKPIKKTTATTLSKVPVSAASVLKKIKSPLTVNFPITKDINFDDFEISIKVEGRQIVVKLLDRGVPISQQAVPIKKVPAPPPWPKDDIIKALEQLRLNFNLLK
nr:hypothetical protein [Mucilaginibacter sp. L294]